MFISSPIPLPTDYRKELRTRGSTFFWDDEFIESDLRLELDAKVDGDDEILFLFFS